MTSSYWYIAHDDGREWTDDELAERFSDRFPDAIPVLLPGNDGEVRMLRGDGKLVPVDDPDMRVVMTASDRMAEQEAVNDEYVRWFTVLHHPDEMDIGESDEDGPEEPVGEARVRRWHIEHPDGHGWTSEEVDELYTMGWGRGDLSWPDFEDEPPFLLDGRGRLYFIDHTDTPLLVRTDEAKVVWDD